MVDFNEMRYRSRPLIYYCEWVWWCLVVGDEWMTLLDICRVRSTRNLTAAKKVARKSFHQLENAWKLRTSKPFTMNFSPLTSYALVVSLWACTICMLHMSSDSRSAPFATYPIQFNMLRCVRLLAPWYTSVSRYLRCGAATRNEITILQCIRRHHQCEYICMFSGNGCRAISYRSSNG